MVLSLKISISKVRPSSDIHMDMLDGETNDTLLRMETDIAQFTSDFKFNHRQFLEDHVLEDSLEIEHGSIKEVNDISRDLLRMVGNNKRRLWSHKNRFRLIIGPRSPSTWYPVTLLKALYQEILAQDTIDFSDNAACDRLDRALWSNLDRIESVSTEWCNKIGNRVVSIAFGSDSNLQENCRRLIVESMWICLAEGERDDMTDNHSKILDRWLDDMDVVKVIKEVCTGLQRQNVFLVKNEPCFEIEIV